MPARASLFKETDVKRAFQAAKLAGIDVARVEIGKDGTIMALSRIVAGVPRRPRGDNALTKLRLKFVHSYCDRHGKATNIPSKQMTTQAA